MIERRDHVGFTLTPASHKDYGPLLPRRNGLKALDQIDRRVGDLEKAGWIPLNRTTFRAIFQLNGRVL
jgi:hypothetical protein